jgi:hypothetical protein
MAVGKPTIVVLHATSKQGTSVVSSLLQTDKFIVKAVTRNANSDSALLQACCLWTSPSELGSDRQSERLSVSAETRQNGEHLAASMLHAKRLSLHARPPACNHSHSLPLGVLLDVSRPFSHVLAPSCPL